jgi:hypothetical protein
MVFFQFKSPTMKIRSAVNFLFVCLFSVFLVNVNLILNGQSPVISDIPGQEIQEGEVYAAINLNAYVADPDTKTSDLTWSSSNNYDLLVYIVDSVATITTKDVDWFGADTITFRVTDPELNTDTDDAVFKVLPVNDPPVVSDIPDQSIDKGGSFNPVHLNSYVTDVDNTPEQLSWTASIVPNLDVKINDSHIAHVTPEKQWTGAASVVFTATDTSDASANDAALFTVRNVNAAPTDISLSPASIQENEPVGTEIGTFTTTDPDAETVFTYTLASGPGDIDNSSFQISGDKLLTSAVFNYEVKSSYSIRIRTTDPTNAWFEKAFTITVTNANEAPTDIGLSDNTIDENLPVNTVIGNLSATDPDAGSSFTFSLVSGTGSTDNASFNISGTQLRSSAVFDYETKSSFSIRIGVSDGTLTFEEVFIITVTFVNEAPTDIVLSDNAIAENLPPNTVVGTLSTTDPNSVDTHTYSLVSGAGSTDNSSFNISGNQLRANASLNHESKSTYAVRIMSTDNLGLTYAEAFTITVTDVNEAPTDITLSGNTIAENLPVNTVIGSLSATDPDVGDTHIFSLVSGAGSTDNGSFNISGSQLRSGASFDFETKSSYSIRVRAFDGALGFEEAFTITVTNANDAPVLENIEPAALSYTEGAGAVQITSAITVTDVDNANLSSGTAQITTGFNGTQDFLRYTALNGISGIFSSVTGILTLSGTASVAAYQAALRRVRYENTNTTNPSTVARAVSFTVSDGTLASNVATRTITINSTNSAPVISAVESTPLIYCAASGPVVISAALVLADADDDSLISAVVRITAGFTTTEDRLRFTNQNNITGSFSSITGILTLSGESSVANYQIALRSIRFENINLVNPVTGTHTISFTVNDGTDNSNTATRNITVSPLITAAFTSSNKEICNDGTSTAPMTINFSGGTAPWSFVVSRLRPNGALISDTTFTNVMTDPFSFQGRVFPTFNATLYRIKSLTDLNSCPGDTAGTGTIRISYKASPTAVISGIDTICPGDTAYLQVALEGSGPWSFTYLINGANPRVVNNIGEAGDNFFNYALSVLQTGTYTLSYVQDEVCTGKVSSAPGEGIVRSYSSPTANISGTATICEFTTANLNVSLTGTPPWKFSYRKNAGDPVEIPNVYSSPQTVSVQKAGTYTLYEVFDKYCKGSVSGSAVITVTPAPAVTLSGLAPAYNKQSTEFVPITGTPPGGTFTGPGVIFYLNNWYFVPSLPPVGTHNIVYAYRASPASCYGYDTVVVRVLEANAVIEFENNRTKYCRNDQPFTITGANLANDIGSFTISGGAGLVDHHDNTATVYPALLGAGGYIITYTYFDGTLLSKTSPVDIGNPPVANFIWESVCFHTGQSIDLKNTSVSTFGNLTDTSYFWKIYTPTGYDTYTTRDITRTFPQPDIYTLELQIETSYGCTDTIIRDFALRTTYILDDEAYSESFESNPLSWRSGTAPDVTVNSWRLGIPLKGFVGAPEGPKCWYTYIPIYPAPKEQSWITSPCFDFTGIERPMVKLNIWRLFNSNRDGANLQASVDSGKTWTLIGEIGDGISWFNSYNILGDPGDANIGWSSNSSGTGNDTEWAEARHALDMLKGKTDVQFRIAYGSDLNAQGNNGIAIDNFWIGERNRTVILEHFTNASDEQSETANAQLNSLVNANELNIVDLQYHTAFPGADPFNQDNPSVPGARVFYYGLSDVPYTILNGGSITPHRFDYDVRPLDPNVVLVESLRDSKFSIRLKPELNENTLEVEAEVFAQEDIPATELTVHLAVIERVITGVTGNNGETSFESVVKAMLPHAAGTTINENWQQGVPRYINQSWNPQHIYKSTELRVVAFIQNESSGEIYQAAMDTLYTDTGISDPGSASPERSFTVYPNPADETANIRFHQEITEEITLQLYNNVGKLVFMKNIPAGTTETGIPVETYPDGLYMLRMLSRNQLWGYGKLMITK